MSDTLEPTCELCKLISYELFEDKIDGHTKLVCKKCHKPQHPNAHANGKVINKFYKHEYK
jgi:hypothetical protein